MTFPDFPKADIPAQDNTRFEATMRIYLPLVFVCLGVFYLLNGWLADDAFISLRVAWNFNHGFGLRWNIAERVQVYTHPLWLFVMTVAARLTAEYHITTIVLSVIISLLALSLPAFLYARRPHAALCVMVLAVTSKAFTDYSSSGLENGLAHLCMGLFVCEFFRQDAGLASFFRLTVLAAFVMLTRLDLALLVAPALVVRFAEAAWHGGWRSFLRFGLMGVGGMFPLIAWLVFSTVYYGFPFPNTAYAKLGISVGQSTLAWQGLLYFTHTLTNDPVTLIVIGIALVLGMRKGMRHLLPLSLGILLYVLYIFRIGGCFMTGRYLTVPYYVALCMLAETVTLRRRSFVLVIVLLFGCGLYAYYPQVRGLVDTNYTYRYFNESTGITDEHAGYHAWTGLIRRWTHPRAGEHEWIFKGQQLRDQSLQQKPVVTVFPYIGMIGFHAGPDVHIVDPLGLSDPLIARLNEPGTWWYIGHYYRQPPDGYLETLATGVNQIVDPEVARQYELLNTITKGPVWSRHRWTAMVGYWLKRTYPQRVDNTPER